MRLHIPQAGVGRTQLSAMIVAVDRFGNVATNVSVDDLGTLGIAVGDRVEIRLTFDRYYASVVGTFGDAPVGELIVYEDSYGLVTIAISNGHAARLMGVSSGDEVRIAVV